MRYCALCIVLPKCMYMYMYIYIYTNILFFPSHAPPLADRIFIAVPMTILDEDVLQFRRTQTATCLMTS